MITEGDSILVYLSTADHSSRAQNAATERRPFPPSKERRTAPQSCSRLASMLGVGQHRHRREPAVGDSRVLFSGEHCETGRGVGFPRGTVEASAGRPPDTCKRDLSAGMAPRARCLHSVSRTCLGDPTSRRGDLGGHGRWGGRFRRNTQLTSGITRNPFHSSPRSALSGWLPRRSPPWCSPICISTTVVSKVLCPLPRMSRRPRSKQRWRLATPDVPHWADIPKDRL